MWAWGWIEFVVGEILVDIKVSLLTAGAEAACVSGERRL